jgi:branched-chain amino acid transport system substrate-binding protein
MLKKRFWFFRLIVVIALLSVMVFTLNGCGTQDQSDSTMPKDTTKTSEQPKEDILIGVSTAITGPAPLEGERTKQGVNMAVEEINAAGGVLGRNLKVIFEDDANAADTVVNAINKLISNKVVAILGPTRSNNVSAAQETIAKAKMPWLVAGTSPKLVTFNNPYLFRMRASDNIVAKMAGKFAVEELKATKVGILFSSDEYGSAAKDIVEAFLKTVNIPVVSEGHNAGDKDMTGQIMKLKNNQVDCIVIWTHAPESAIACRQLKELNLNVPVIGWPTFTNQAFYDQVDAAIIEGHYSVTDFSQDNPDPEIQAYVKKFEATYNAIPEVHSTAYYDGVYIIADAIRRANSTDSEALRKALMETKDLKGMMSTKTANEKGELVHETLVVKIVNKTPTLVKSVRE